MLLNLLGMTVLINKKGFISLTWKNFYSSIRSTIIDYFDFGRSLSSYLNGWRLFISSTCSHLNLKNTWKKNIAVFLMSITCLLCFYILLYMFICKFLWHDISLLSQYAVEEAISRCEGKHFPLITTEKFLCCLKTK